MNMQKLLIHITGNAQRTRAAVSEALRLAAASESTELHLLNVQPQLTSHAAMFFSHEALHALHEEAGREELRLAQELLASSGVPVFSYVRVGRSAPTIAEIAQELGCNRVVFGADPVHHRGVVFGSLAEQVRALSSPSVSCEVIG
jgi:nucleotide-binding universal stress UspA family protein